MTKLEWGTKRTCQSCSARFYDMRNTPIICPKCGETFEIQTLGRRTRARAAVVPDVVEKPIEDEINLDDIEISDDLDDDIVDDDDDDDDSLIEDTDDLTEDLDDVVDVIDTVDDKEE